MMQSADRTRDIVDKIARLGVKVTATKSRLELWKALQGSCETARCAKMVMSYHIG
ncbi:Lmo0850 family protein [Domibacillus mangrovi]|uniref:Lmo0850 family protein n=1 Tax=Domibacillus mangrovi TaxID=1714354 RepID=UPI0031830FC1